MDDDEQERAAELADVQDRLMRTLRDAGWEAKVNEGEEWITSYDEVSEHEISITVDWA